MSVCVCVCVCFTKVAECIVICLLVSTISFVEFNNGASCYFLTVWPYALGQHRKQTILVALVLISLTDKQHTCNMPSYHV